MSRPGRSLSPQQEAAASSPSPSAVHAMLDPAAAADAATATPDTQHDAAGPAPSSAEQPPFEPLFTLLTNSTTNTTIHPRVHYVFSDDDPGVLASAAADPSHRALVVDLVPTSQQHPSKTSESTATAVAPASHAKDADAATAAAGSSNGWSVAWASSLSPEFAVTGSHLALQQHGAEGGGALMLRVEGVEREPVDVAPGDVGGGGSSASLRNSASAAAGEDVDALLDDFRRRMDLLRRVVGEGERRREVLDGQAEAEHDTQQQEQPLPHEGDGKAVTDESRETADKA